MTVRGAPDRAVTIADVARSAHYRNNGSLLIAEHFYDPPTEQPGPDGKGNKSAAYAFGFHGAEVEVDEETGEVRVLRLVAAHDIGRAINPLGRGRPGGGRRRAGPRLALFETMFADDGHTLISNLQDYKIPAAVDVPEPSRRSSWRRAIPRGPTGPRAWPSPASSRSPPPS